MGRLEEGQRKRSRQNRLQKIILNSVAVAGVLSIALVAPNVLGALGKLGLLPHPRQKEVIQRVRDRLVSKGFLKYEGRFLRLTPRGEAELRKRTLAEFRHTAPKRWDKKWRILIFDIPEYRKPLRDKIRRTLRTIGFVRLQDSVWLYPYDCEDLITLLKADFRIGKEVLYLIVDSLENDVSYRKRFNLRSY